MELMEELDLIEDEPRLEERVKFSHTRLFKSINIKLKGDPRDEYNASVKMWTETYRIGFPNMILTHGGGIEIVPNTNDPLRLITFIDVQRIESYLEPTPETVVVRLENGTEYQFRFDLFLVKMEFIHMFQVPR